MWFSPKSYYQGTGYMTIFNWIVHVTLTSDISTCQYVIGS